MKIKDVALFFGVFIAVSIVDMFWFLVCGWKSPGLTFEALLAAMCVIVSAVREERWR